MRISAVPFDVVDVVWEDARRFLEPAIKSGGRRYNIETVKKFIDDRIIALWVALNEENDIKAVITTRVQQYPEGRALEMDWIGGEEMTEWLPEFHSTLESYARDMNCDFMAGQGRKGWTKPLQTLGWEAEFVSYRKDLTDG